jgi:hypothetical protein
VSDERVQDERAGAERAGTEQGTEQTPGGWMAVVRGSTPNHLHLRERLTVLVIVVLGVDAAASVIAWAVERDATGSDIHSYGDALFWTTSQLLTVSSSMSNPVTGAGMWLDVGMEFVGITVVAALAGSLGSFLYRRSMERNPAKHH